MNDPIDLSGPKLDSTYLACLGRWGKWTLTSLCGADATDDLQRDIVMQLLQELGRAMTLPRQHKTRYVDCGARISHSQRRSYLILARPFTSPAPWNWRKCCAKGTRIWRPRSLLFLVLLNRCSLRYGWMPCHPWETNRN